MATLPVNILVQNGSASYRPSFVPGRPGDVVQWNLLAADGWQFQATGVECDRTPPGPIGSPYTPWPATAAQPVVDPLDPNKYTVTLPSTTVRVTYKYAINLQNGAQNLIIDPDIGNDPGTMPEDDERGKMDRQR